MDKKNIDTTNLMVTGAHASTEIPSVRVQDDIFIIVTQAFGPRGDNLVGLSDVTFDGFPAVTLLLRANGEEGLVHLSPFHGDARKQGFIDIKPGTRCELLCPVSKQPLDRIGRVSDSGEADYYAIYLTPSLSEGELVAVSDLWNDYHSRIIDGSELISAWNESLSA